MSAQHPSRPEITRFVHPPRARSESRSWTLGRDSDTATHVVSSSVRARLEAEAGPPDAAYTHALPCLQRAAEQLDGEGCAYVATVAGAVVAWGGLRARPDRPNVAIVGRHSEVDMQLPDELSLSLRHVALFTHAFAPGAPPTLQVVDLASTLGTRFGPLERFASVVAEHRLHLAAGGLHLFAIATRPGGSLPAAEELLDSLGDVAVTAARPSAALDEPPLGVLRLGTTRRVDGRAPPDDAGAGLAPGDTRPCGPRSAVADDVVVTREQARAGFTIGRYSRADLCLTGSEFEYLSRLHAMVIAIDGRLWIVDTASTNGLWCDLEPTRIAELPRDRPALIGLGPVELQWFPADTR